MEVALDRSAALRPFLPRLTIKWIVEQPEQRVQAIDGTVVFVDISGFTKMSERLARNGRIGAEEVTDVVGDVFSLLLATAYANGGGLIKFGGDALLLFFSGPDHAPKAVRAAAGMRRTLSELGGIDTSAGKVRRRPLRPVPLLPGRRTSPGADHDRRNRQHHGDDGGDSRRRRDRRQPRHRRPDQRRPAGGAQG